MVQKNEVGEKAFENFNLETSKRDQRILLLAAYSAIEPLGLIYLSGLARDLGFDRRIHLVKDHNYEEVRDVVEEFKPDFIGETLYTGNQVQAFEGLKPIKRDHPEIPIIAGGYHPTYQPVDTINQEAIDYVVMSEGFKSLERILRGEISPGILPLEKPMKFPKADRETLYKDYPEHRDSRIKSLITMTGCPYTCAYCFNSSTPGDLNLSPELAEQVSKSLGMSGRLFPSNLREIEDIFREGEEVAEKWAVPGQIFYFQDDVYGLDDKPGGFLEQMKKDWLRRVGVHYAFQMRFEMTESERRLELIKDSGGDIATLAIESSIPVVRKEILGRNMKDELIFDGTEKLAKYGFKMRTEQISANPTGTTTVPTLMNLDADIDLLRLNIELYQKYGLPTMAWLSTFAPYIGTKQGNLSVEQGFYEDLLNGSIHDSFFDESALRHLKEWVGDKYPVQQLRESPYFHHDPSMIKDPELLAAFHENRKRYNDLCEKLRNDDSVWLNPDEQERYRKQNAEFRRRFNFFFYVPDGDVLARKYLTELPSEKFNDENLGRYTINHLLSRGLLHHPIQTGKILYRTGKIYLSNGKLAETEEEKAIVKESASFFGALPVGEAAVKRFLEYGRERNDYSTSVKSTAARHELYDGYLYLPSGQDKVDGSRKHELETYRQSDLKI